MKLSESGIVASVLDLLAQIEDHLKKSNRSTPAALAAVGGELGQAIEQSTQRLEAAAAGLGALVKAEFSALQARVSEPTARVVELSDQSEVLHRSIAARLEAIENEQQGLASKLQALCKALPEGED